VGGIIIDDIVLPGGETRMGVLGGGVSHAAMGIAIWDQRPGIVARAGRDLPDSARQRLERDVDMRGVIATDLPQARAWQLFEWDGRRTEIFRVDNFEPFALAPPPEESPAVYRDARGLYVLTDHVHLSRWRALFPHATLFWEPMQHYMVAANAADFRAGLRRVDIVSPNLLEAQQIYGVDDPHTLVWAMLDDGAPVVALRLGAAGSLVGERKSGAVIAIPPVPVSRIVDQTGAGNTYCGGFLVGWLATGDLRKAGCYGAVSASFALEVTGVADPPPDKRKQRDWRYNQLIAQSTRAS
jgi:sugar/nucleoside kinase (ribokinase family)